MNNLKELTHETHRQAERSAFARKLLKGLDPEDYHRYLVNQYVIYSALEYQAEVHGVLEGIESIKRAEQIRKDVSAIESEYQIKPDDNLVCPTAKEYVKYVTELTNAKDILAHVYVRHFGDMYGGQMIHKRNVGPGHMYQFDDVEALKQKVRNRLSDDMTDEANRCFEFAVSLFKDLDNE